MKKYGVYLLIITFFLHSLNLYVIPDHIIIVIEENHGFDDLIGNSNAPYLNQLAQQGALFTQSYGITHPSQPNYIAFFAGSLLGVSDNSCPLSFTNVPNLASELIRVGKTFGGLNLNFFKISFQSKNLLNFIFDSYSQSLPSVGSTVCSSGYYQRKHNPWVNFDNVPASVNLPFTSFVCNSTECNLPTGY